MKLEKFPFEQSHRMHPAQQVAGKVMIPKGAKIVHVGAAPPNGEMYLYCEVSDVEVPKVRLDFVVLKEGEKIPDGFTYRGYILAIPILFVYEQTAPAIVTNI